MSSFVHGSKDVKQRSVQNRSSKRHNKTTNSFQFADNRAEFKASQQLQQAINASPQSQVAGQTQLLVNSAPNSTKFPIQCQTNDSFQHTTESKENNTGLPDHLKRNTESLSGISLDDVNVHYNSTKPQELHAHGYAQGAEIHLGAGQEKHLPHELWHVVQQKQGRVKPTMQLKSQVSVNDDPSLEKEADIMGAKAASTPNLSVNSLQVMSLQQESPVQRYVMPLENDKNYRVSENRNIVTLMPQSLFATKEMITHAAQALRAARSMVTLTEDKDGNRSPWEPFKGGTRTKTVYPVKLSWVPETVPNESIHKDLSNTNANSILYHSWADCHRTAQTVMGSSAQTSEHTEKPLVKQGDDYDTMEPMDTSRRGMDVDFSDAQANRGAYALFEYAFPQFVDVLTEKGLHETHADLIERINSIKTQKADSQKMRKWWITYQNKILPVKELYDLFTESFGINEHSNPEIGDSLSQVGNEAERFREKNAAMKLALKYGMDEFTPTSEMRSSGLIPQPELDQLKDLWNFHWAGVIMKDGSDYVTLENLSVENINEINRKWYFKMYGKAGQSFHTEAQASSPHSGDAPITAGFRHVPEDD